MASQSFMNLENMTKSANIIQKVWLKKHPRNCPICMDLMGDRGFVDTPCKHKFCLECYTKLEDPRCPLCRSYIPLHNTSEYVPLYDERESADHNRMLEDEWYANSPHAPDDDEFAQNPLIFIGNLIDNFTEYLQNYTRPTVPTHLPTLRTISGYGYIMIGLLILSLFSPYISLYVLILLFIMLLPDNQQPASNLYESLLNNIFTRHDQAPRTPTRTPIRARTPPPPTPVRMPPPPTPVRMPPTPRRTQTFGQIFEGFMHNQLSTTPMDRARPYIYEGVRPSMHRNYHVNPYITAHFSDRRNNW
jgi:hypothetical protein